MTKIKINDKNIKTGGAPFIIAEAGINHNGKLEKTFQMIKVAKQARADAIKFQTFKAEEFISDPKLMFSYKSQGKRVTESMLKMFKRYEFSRKEWFAIKNQCDKEKITFLSTPQNQSDLDLLQEIGIPAIKVGSDDFVNIPLIKGYTKTGLPLILSAGMADLDEIYQTLNAVGALKGYPTVLMLCTSEYPTPLEDVNILKLKTLRALFPKLILGFSDHTRGALASSLALAMGAVVFEKHFTLDHNLPGPDHWFSEDPEGLKQWVGQLKDAYIILGNPELKPTKDELKIRKLARRSVVALVDISKGDVFDSKNIGLKRPGSGLPPRYFESVIGLIAKDNIKKGNLINLEDFKI